MILSKRVGEILKEARLERKLSIRDVARETNIAAKYIEALEAEDFSQFPGDTYAMGFLRNYVEFLNMDEEEILELYRGQQIDQSETPVEELVKPEPVYSFDFSRLSAFWDPRYLVLAFGALIVFLVVYLFANGSIALPSLSSGKTDAVASASPCKDREIEDFTLPAIGAAKKIFLDDKSSLRFSVDRHNVKLCLIEVKRKPAEGALAHIGLYIDDESSYDFFIKEREEYIISSRIAGLSGLARSISLRPSALADYTAQVEFRTLPSQTAEPQENASTDAGQNNEDNSGTSNANNTSATGLIQITLEFVKPSFVNWVKDGQYFRGKIWPAGKTLTLEANNRLEIKIGNGAGVRIHRDGVRPRLAGRPNQIVTFVYSLVPDPLDPTIKKIKETVR